MAEDVDISTKVREGGSWDLLTCSVLKSNISVAQRGLRTPPCLAVIKTPRTIRLCPPIPALFFGKFLNESKLQLLNLQQSFFRGKNLIKFSHAF